MFKNIRQPAAVGQFYPAEMGELREMVNGYLEDAETPQPPFIMGATPPNPPLRKGRGIFTPIINARFAEENARRGGSGGFKSIEIKALIVPHAGYAFSGLVAAYAYKELEDRKTKIVVMVGNSHTAYFDGIAADDSLFWRMPLGDVEVDKKFVEKLMEMSRDIKFNNQAHRAEHSLEVQVPFLQSVLKGNFKIVPLLFGNAGDDGYKKLAVVLAKNLREDDLVVISSDMSHYPSYEDANKIDNETLKKIKEGDIKKLEAHIAEVENKNISNEQTLLCGIDGVKTAMELANILGWKAGILKYANSGDSSYGDKESVVGYGAIAFAQTQSSKFKTQNYSSKLKDDLSKKQKKLLLQIAKASVENYVKTDKVPEFEISDRRLNWKEGAFVTLKKDGELRGCIGQIIPSEKPLWQVVRDMAIAAAMEDGRFSPLSENELDKLEYEISVLSKPEKIAHWQDIELGRHGVIVRKGLCGGVFLPQVADETGWSREEFLSRLCSQKAGLAANCYKDKDIEISVFTAQVF